ncbi:MAG: sigma-54-dependent Fis family transcriptional regulator [Ignavibacteriae bacterium]|nr:MAG: sigma-54-dependent Fis family transcriptional regulator [Ignavibacteriota bacterium]
MIRILVSAEKQISLTNINNVLTDAGYDFTAAYNHDEVLKKCREFKYDILIADSNIDTIAFINDVLTLEPEIKVILSTASEIKRTIIRTINTGAIDFITEPVDKEELLLSINRAVEKIKLVKENTLLKYKIETTDYMVKTDCNFISPHKKMIEILNKTPKIAASDSTILITGEKGTGKKTFAKYIYNNSSGKNRPLIIINCADTKPHQLERELFGYVKGAFDDTVNDRKGYFELADNGTIFFDEIGELSLQTQLKILRALKDKQFSRAGSTRVQYTNARIIASSSRSLFKLVNEGKFIEELYYILNEFEFYLPPLKNSYEDILYYFEKFVEEFSKQKKKKVNTIDENVIEMLVNYNWSGNINEIKNTAERVIILCEDGRITQEMLPSKFIANNKHDFLVADYSKQKEIIIRNFEVNFISKYLQLYKGNVAATARAINFHPVSLRQKLAKLGIQREKIKCN